MKKSNSFKLSFLIVGAFIGGGFASGKEIMVYFSQFGYVSLLFCVLSGLIFYYLVKTFLFISYNNKANLCYSINIFKKNINLKPILMFCNFVIVAGMFAGISELGNVNFNNLGIYLVIFTIALTFFVLIKGLKSLEYVNFMLIPIMLLSLTLVIVFSIGKYNFVLIKNNAILSFFNSVVYMMFNVLALCTFLLEIGKHYSKKQIKKCSVISSITLTLILLIINIFFVTYYTTVQNQNLPIVFLANNISKAFGIFITIMVYVGMLTTLLSCSYTIKQYINKRFNNAISILIILVVGVTISLIGFEKIISKLYTLLGIIGIFFCVYVICAKLNK